MEWSQDLNLGIAEIDEQHKEYINCATQLLEAITLKDTASALKLFDEAIIHIKDHFSTEETYFEEYNYPAGKAHRLVHDQFVKEIERMKKEFSEGKELDEKDKRNLTGWLVNHIKSLDRHYADFFHKKGIM
jgi:hemerythrin